MDGFLSYDQIKVHPKYKERTDFTTPWGTFVYAKMPFGMLNAGATFQREMDIAFAEEEYNFVVVYMDDITMFSKSDNDHLKHLKQVFLKCRKFSISLNPKNSNFSMREGKLLGRIISKYGIKIDPDSVDAIQKISIPRNKKEVHPFIGRVNFLRRLVPSFAKILRFITNMLRNASDMKCKLEENNSFNGIKKALIEAPVLISLVFFSLQSTLLVEYYYRKIRKM